ncbi:helix-turn-helix domain-containing protein [Streptomyces sp. E-15]
MEKVFDSGDFPAEDAFSAWEKATADAVMPTSFKLIGTDVFRGRVSTMPLGAVQVSAMAYSSYLTRRTPKLIRVSDPEIFAFGVTGSGSHVIEQNRHRAAVRPGELLFFESSRPFETHADGECILIQFPRTLLPLPNRHVTRLLCQALPGDQGMGRLLTAFLTHLAEDSTSYTPGDAARLGTVGLDLVTATLAHFLEREDDMPSDSRQRVLYMRITSFIERHLADSRLTAAEVAAAHHISVRSLHRVFQQHGVTVRSWIRGRRLERCRRDLADPSKRHVPVHAIAARWGFPQPADFTRAFRTAHGITPSDYRNHVHRHGSRTGTQSQVPGAPGQGSADAFWR